MQTLIKTKWNRKWKIPHMLLELCFSSCKNRELKVKLWRLTFIFSKEIFFNISVLPKCMMYWIKFQKIDTVTCQKALLHTLFCLFLKSSKVFSVSFRFKPTTLSKLRLWHRCFPMDYVKLLRILFLQNTSSGFL